MSGGRSYLLYACRSTYVGETAEIIWRSGGQVHALVDNMHGPFDHSAVARVVTPDALSTDERRLPVVIPLITPGHRLVVEREARGYGLMRFPALVDRTSVVARSAVLGEGVCINAMAMIGAGSKLGRFVLVNRSASVGHDVELHDFVTLGPACVVAGQIAIESGAFIGSGAVLAPKVRIGRNAIVGAGAVVVRDVPAFSTVVGNPARVIKESDTGYNQVAVPDDALTIDIEAAK